MADYNYVEANGTIIPDTATTRQSVVTEFTGIFGDDFVTDAETPEGAWIDAETTSRQSVARNNAAVANQINPNLAGGPFLDAIWALTGGQRVRATRSTVQATLTGIANTAIPARSRARTATNEEFRSVNPVVIPTSGTLPGVAFESVEPGAVAAGVGELNTIVDSVLGWETITNTASASPGRDTESDEISRSRRRRTLGLQGRSIAEAVSSNVTDVVGVRSLAFRENPTNATTVIDGITLTAHSVWVAVDGGADADIGAALLRSKTAGAAWNGAQSVAVIEPFSGQSYTVRFDRPTTTAIAVRATVRRSTDITDPVAAVRDSILRYARGEIAGEEGFVVGADVSPFEIGAAIDTDNPSLFVERVEVDDNTQTPVYSTDVLAIPLNGIATVVVGNIVVVVT